jgi:aromatic ring-opening dioxygenase catalytic subunit (LigB family)
VITTIAFYSIQDYLYFAANRLEPSKLQPQSRVESLQFQPSTAAPSAQSALHSTDMSSSKSRTPVYFFSHGGPNIMYDVSHPAYTRLALLGREIMTKVKPKAVIVFSAHWEADRPGLIQVNTAVHEPLIYDFYGFPGHYYKEKFVHQGSPEVAQRVLSVLEEAGIKAEGVERGLDHGVWAAFKVAFDDEFGQGGALEGVPVVQVSLFDVERGATGVDAEKHIKLGRAVEKLRDDGILIIVSGMAVHNLRDMGYRELGRVMEYTETFDEALKDAVEDHGTGEERDKAMIELLSRADARKAHPTFEHLLPIHVGVGAAGSDKGERLWTLKEGSFSWAQYRFGSMEA